MRRAVLYTIATIAYLAAVNWYVATHPMYADRALRVDDNYALLDETAARCGPGQRYLVLGSSYVKSSFVTDENDCRFVKFTVGAMPLGDALNIVRNLPADSGFGGVVIGLGFDQANPVDTDSTVYRRYWAANPVDAWLWSIPLVRVHGIGLLLVKEDLKCLVGHGACMRVALPPAPDPSQRLALLEESIDRQYGEYQPFVGSVSVELRELLEELRDLCAARDIDLLVYTAPVAPRFHALLGKEFIDGFLARVGESGVPYLDTNPLAQSWDVAYFDDATHVSPLGARIVTAELQEALSGAAPQITAR